MSLAPEDVNDDLSGLTTEELIALDEVLKSTYTKKYPVVALLKDSRAGGEGCADESEV